MHDLITDMARLRQTELIAEASERSRARLAVRPWGRSRGRSFVRTRLMQLVAAVGWGLKKEPGPTRSPGLELAD